MFQFLGHNQFLEISATPKEIMLFHDSDLVLLRFACGFNMSSIDGSFRDVKVGWKVGCIPKMGGFFLRLNKYNVFVGFALLALLVMNFDRYLAISYPIFHRTSVTKRKLLALLATLIVVEIALYLMSVNDLVISNTLFILIFFIIIFPPMIFMNYKLFVAARKSRRNNRISPEMEKTFSWKNISSCLLATACFVVLSVSVFVYIGLSTNFKDSSTLNNGDIAAFWGETIASMNSTFNCLIFYWKDKVLRTEGMKVIKSMKICICRKVQN